MNSCTRLNEGPALAGWPETSGIGRIRTSNDPPKPSGCHRPDRYARAVGLRPRTSIPASTPRAAASLTMLFSDTFLSPRSTEPT